MPLNVARRILPLPTVKTLHAIYQMQMVHRWT